MKKIILFSLLIWLFNVTLLCAQTIPPTGAGAASINPPPSWIGATASTSSKTLYQGNVAKPWKNGSIPAVPGQLNATFLSLFSNNSVIKEVSTTISGLTAGWLYEFSYNVMTASANSAAGFTDPAYAAEVGIAGTNIQNQYSFTAANSSIWISGKLQFVASGSTAKLTFRTLGQSAKGSIANLSINSGAIKAVCGVNAQVKLSKTALYNKCFQPLVNLNDAYTGVVPQGWSLVWYKNDTHSGLIPIVDPTSITTEGDYYAFFYNGNGCFNTDLSKAKVTVSIHPPLAGDGQVILTKSALTNVCPVTTTVDLTSAFIGQVPIGATVRWFDNPTHSGLPVADPAHASVLVSKYYAFYYDIGNDCYNTSNSTSVVKITKRDCSMAAPIQWNSEIADSEAKSEIAVYPNPVSDELQILNVEPDKISGIQMFDTKGMLVYESKKSVKSIDVTHFVAGMHIVKITLKSGVTNSFKVLVKK